VAQAYTYTLSRESAKSACRQWLNARRGRSSIAFYVTCPITIYTSSIGHHKTLLLDGCSRCGAEPPLLMIKLDAFYGKKVAGAIAKRARTKLRSLCTAANVSALSAGMETFILKLLDVYGVAKVRWNGARTPQSVA
jgi:hypothetical protein